MQIEYTFTIYFFHVCNSEQTLTKLRPQNVACIISKAQPIRKMTMMSGWLGMFNKQAATKAGVR